MASSSKSVTYTVTTANEGTDWLSVTAGRHFDAWVEPTGTATITLQRRLENGDGTVYDVKSYASGSNPAPEIGYSANNWEYRLYCKIGDFTSGPVDIGLWTT